MTLDFTLPVVYGDDFMNGAAYDVICVDGAGLTVFELDGALEGDVYGWFESTGYGSLVDTWFDWANQSSCTLAARRQKGRLADEVSRDSAVVSRLLSEDCKFIHLAYAEYAIAVYVGEFAPQLVIGFQVSAYRAEVILPNVDELSQEEWEACEEIPEHQHSHVINHSPDDGTGSSEETPFVVAGTCEPSNLLLASILGALRANALDVADMTANPQGAAWITTSKCNFRKLAERFGTVLDTEEEI